MILFFIIKYRYKYIEVHAMKSIFSTFIIPCCIILLRYQIILIDITQMSHGSQPTYKDHLTLGVHSTSPLVSLCNTISSPFPFCHTPRYYFPSPLHTYP